MFTDVIVEYFGIPYSFVVKIAKWTEWMTLVILAAVLIIWGWWGFLGWGEEHDRWDFFGGGFC